MSTRNWPKARVVVAGGTVALLLALSAPATAAPSGYRMIAGDGGVFSFGLPFKGSPASNPKNSPAIAGRDNSRGAPWHLAATADGNGYWALNGYTNKVFIYGNATYYGQPADEQVGAPWDLVPTGLAIIPTPTEHGYWILEAPLSGAATVRAYGDAVFYGDTRKMSLRGSPVGFAVTTTGKGYWIAYSDGGVFSFGDATFQGSMGARHLNQPIVGITATADSKGYWLAARDGGVFAFGSAQFSGSMASKRLNAPVIGIATSTAQGGYWLVASDGGVFSFGGAPFLGSMASKHLNRAVTGLAAN